MLFRQEKILSCEELQKFEPRTRLSMVIEQISEQICCCEKAYYNIYPMAKTGRRRHGFMPLLLALVAKIVYKIPDNAQLVERLETDSALRYDCYMERSDIPSESTISRFFTRLSNTNILTALFEELLKKGIHENIINCTSIAVDSTVIAAYEKSKPSNKVEKDGRAASWAVKTNSQGKRECTFGYKLHVAVDTKSELPLALTVTPGSEHDSTQLLPLIEQINTKFNKKPNFVMCDAAYDSSDVYKKLFQDHSIQAIIPLNNRSAESAEGYSKLGVPVCSMGQEMTYWGRDGNYVKFRCPHSTGNYECPMGTSWCSESNYGMVVKYKIENNCRMMACPNRKGKQWKELYNSRTSVERCFSRLKLLYGAKNITVQKIDKVKTQLTLSCIALLSATLSVNKIQIRVAA